MNRNGISVLAMITMLLNSCSPGKRDVLDYKMQKSYDEYEKHMFDQQQKIEQEKKKEVMERRNKFPKFSKMLAKPQAPMVGTEKLVSISVTEDVSLKDTLIELSRLTDIDMEIDPEITGGVIMRVRDKPLSEVIDRLARLGNLRYGSKNGVLFIEKDTPYIEDYVLDFLNLNRSNKSDSSVNTSISSSGGNTSGGSSSNNTINASYEGDLWSSVENNVKQIIGHGVEKKTNAKGNDGNISINKQASILSVVANSRQHDAIREYLNKVKKSTSSQVLIEAKIVEVVLRDEYRTGINWNALKMGPDIGFKNNFPSGIDTGSFVVGKDVVGDNLKNFVDMVQVFGNTRTISSPRLNAMNNQQAVLSFVQNQVYFKVNIESSDPTTTSTAQTNQATTALATMTLSSELNTVPIGLILSLQPSINEDSNEITMNIRPTLSKQADKVPDPAVSFLAARSGGTESISSLVPVVEVKEVDSMVKIKSGEVIVFGGLMEERGENSDVGIPGVSQVPGVGNFFKSVSKENKVIQTVIFLKATIVPTNFVPLEDKHFYNIFAKPRDVNPWNL